MAQVNIIYRLLPLTAVFLAMFSTGAAALGSDRQTVTADLTRDGQVDRGDVDYMRGVFFSADPRADLNGDGRVDFADLAQLKAVYEASNGHAPVAGRQAASRGGTGPIIYLEPASVQGTLGDSITLDIIADFRPETTIGGGFDLRFDESLLDFASWVRADLGDALLSREPDIVPGGLLGIAFGDFDFGIQGPALVGTVTLQIDGLLPNELTMEDTITVAGPFVDFSTFTAMNVEYAGSAINVALPADPTIHVQPDTVDLGKVAVQASVTADIVVTSLGEANLVLGEVGIDDSLAAPFSIITDGCSQQSLPSLATCTITVRFAPDGVSQYMDSFDIPSNAPASPVATVSVTGAGAPGPEPDISTSAPQDTVNFSPVEVGQAAVWNVSIFNNGTAGLDIGLLGDSDPLAPPLSLSSDNCSGITLSPGGACVIAVRFDAELGSFSDTLNIPSNDPDTPQLILSVLAEGVPPPPLDLTGTVQGYGNVAALICVNQTSGQRVQAYVATAIPWSCERIGLVISAGDKVDMFLRGIIPVAE